MIATFLSRWFGSYHTLIRGIGWNNQLLLTLLLELLGTRALLWDRGHTQNFCSIPPWWCLGGQQLPRSYIPWSWLVTINALWGRCSREAWSRHLQLSYRQVSITIYGAIWKQLLLNIVLQTINTCSITMELFESNFHQTMVLQMVDLWPHELDPQSKITW